MGATMISTPTSTSGDLNLSHPDDLVFSAADALQVTLHKMSGTLKGFAPRKYSVGGFWSFNQDLLVESDCYSPTQCSFFSRISGNLWTYLVATNKGLWLVFLDGDRAKLRVGASKEVGTGTVTGTFNKLLPAIRDSYKFNLNTCYWEPFDIAALVSGH